MGALLGLARQFALSSLTAWFSRLESDATWRIESRIGGISLHTSL